jgi:hypothetical protein
MRYYVGEKTRGSATLSENMGRISSLLGLAVLFLAGCLVKPGAQPSQITYSFPTTLAIKWATLCPVPMFAMSV